jgi:phosphatidylserine/phosphatidylglycerophosphate/cardiolipin synthase-like enzyme
VTARLTTGASVAAAIASGTDVSLSAYILRPGSAVENALERAADRGARVSVTLEGNPYRGGRGADSPARANRRAAECLRQHGVAVRLTGRSDVPVHLKAAVVDGTAYLDDRNWTGDGHDTIVATSDARAVAAVGAALAGRAQASVPELALDKQQALRLEARAIRGAAGDRLDVQSESFGYSCIYEALRYRASHGTHVRLVVSAREFAHRGNVAERSALRRLRAAGVDVRVAVGEEKLCIGGDRGWVGSANATFAGRPMLDWGLRTRDPALLRELERRFASTWSSATEAPA